LKRVRFYRGNSTWQLSICPADFGGLSWSSSLLLSSNRFSHFRGCCKAPIRPKHLTSSARTYGPVMLPGPTTLTKRECNTGYLWTHVLNTIKDGKNYVALVYLSIIFTTSMIWQLHGLSRNEAALDTNSLNSSLPVTILPQNTRLTTRLHFPLPPVEEPPNAYLGYVNVRNPRS
jgi:hypothetical protein